MNSKTLRIIALILFGACALSSCGGGSSGSPSVSFSASSLAFGDEEQGSTSEPLLLTLTNSGTAPLTITGIVASANFAETNNCTTLAAGASCAINVILAPDTTGSLKGTVTFTDNAVGSPQTVSLSGTAVTPSTLTGVCVGGVPGQGQGGCAVLDWADGGCVAGQPAATPAVVDVCPNQPYILDTSTQCDLPGTRLKGSCVATSAVVSCSVQGQQCGGTDSTPCCSGFTCTTGTGGSFCQPTAGSGASGVRSSLDPGLADRLR